MQGQIVNGFELKKLLGRGGMAEVWYAENEIGKPAAIKILNENLSHNQQIVERFHNEALVMVKLNHPNIRQVYGYGYLGERHCIIMEYLEGNDLEELLKDGRRFTEEEVRRWWDQTVDALNYTHAMGIVHRDIKPSNIFLDEYGNIKLLDFGIAKMMENASMTQTGMVMGTPMYMSPEQVNDIKHVDNHTDLYSLAVSFVHMLTGKKPYDDDNCSVFEIQMSIVTKPLDLSDVPEAWRGFLAPYLEKDPQKRPALRRFEAAPPAIKANDDHAERTESKKQLAATVAAPQPKKPINKPQPKEPASEGQPKPPVVEPQPSEPQDKPKGKIGLWIGLGVAALAVLLVVLLKKPKEEPVVVNPDTETFNACNTVSDYRAYMRSYGTNALHYADARSFVDRYVADSLKLVQDNAEEYFRQGQKYYYDGNYEKAVELYRKSSDLENAKGQTELGRMYEKGLGVNQDYKEAVKWYRKAAEKGDALGQANLGYMYIAGYGVAQDYQEALKWCRKAVEQGEAYGQVNLAWMYRDGKGVAQSYQEAVKLYLKAAEQGNVIGQTNVGYMYENGLGVAKDRQEAIKWYRKAAQQGDDYSQKALKRLGEK